MTKTMDPLIKRFDSLTAARSTSEKTRIGLFMLSIILLELSLGEPLETSQNATATGQHWMLEHGQTLGRFQKRRERRKDDLSMAYHGSLKYCVESAMDPLIDFEKDNWLDDAFSKVVLPLNNEYLAFTGKGVL